jgi:RNA polymerase sigma factor (TIGR02999 family)
MDPADDSDGRGEALRELVSLVYDELKRLARLQLHGHYNTLSTTDLVHEAWLKLAAHGAPTGRDRAHFYSIVVRTMRQVLVDHARRRSAMKRGGYQPILITGGDTHFELRAEDLLALETALEHLAAVDERLRTIVELRFYAGLDEKTIAEILDVSVRTVERDWVKARLFLHREIYPDGERPEA